MIRRSLYRRGVHRRAVRHDEDDDRSFQFQMAILEEDLVE
jgi:hypothetical protein